MRPPSLPQSGQQFYDQIMSRIEPELTTRQMPSLADKYKGETPQQAQARADRYAKAYAEYDKAHDAFVASTKEQVDLYRKEAFLSLEKEDRAKEQSALSRLEASFGS